MLVIVFMAVESASAQEPVGAASAQHMEAVTITGMVVDTEGNPISEAEVSAGDGGKNTATVTTEDGSFTLSTTVGAEEVRIIAPGFDSKRLYEEVRGTNQVNLGQIVLVLERNVTKIVVTASRQELAQEQLKVELGQRILGVMPNFLVTYDPHPVPLDTKQKYTLAFKTLTDPETIGWDLILAGIQQKTATSSSYGSGVGGFSRNFGSSYGTGAVDTMLGSAVFPSLFKQDPRYFYKGTGSITHRALYAMSMSFICKGDNGHWQYNYSGLLGGLAAGGIASLYAPTSDRHGVTVTFGNSAMGIGSSAMSNLFQEFLIRKFTRNAR